MTSIARRAPVCVVAAAALALVAANARAQPMLDLSNRPIRIVSPFAAGSVSDISLRLVAERLVSCLRAGPLGCYGRDSVEVRMQQSVRRCRESCSWHTCP